MREHDENYPIKKLQPYRKYKVPTLNNKINEIIQRINKSEAVTRSTKLYG